MFFEIGVRLAVNKSDPLFVLCDETPPLWDSGESKWLQSEDPSTSVLEEFFVPTKFTFADFQSLQDRIDSLDDDNTVRLPGAKVAPGRTYQVVSESINRRDEPGGFLVHDLLVAEAQGMAGPAVPEEGGLPVLFKEVLWDQVGRAALEYLIAAWFYLDGRYNLIRRCKDNQLSATDPKLISLQQIGQDLKDRLRNAPLNEYDQIAAEISDGWEIIKPKQEAKDG